MADGKETMQTQPAKVKLTYDDLLALPDDGLRHELIDGEHVVTPSPNWDHQGIVGNIYHAVRGYLDGRPLGRIVLAPFDIILTRNDVVEPDLVYFTNERIAQVVTTNNAQGPPNLAVEVLSPSTRRRDEQLKRRLYERQGIDEYWVVDPELETIKVYRLEGTRYRRVAELEREAGDRLTSPLFPGLSLDLADIFKLP